MATIFISGSREITFIPEEVKERVDRIIDSGFDIVLGDSERGVDAAIARYLASQSYESVSIYTIHDRPRISNILNAWEIRRIETAASVKTDKAGKVRNRRELETAKDKEMGSRADFGLVVWQSTYTNRFGAISTSKGSLRNMYQLLTERKPVVLYKAPMADYDDTTFSCHELRTLKDLSRIIDLEPDVVIRAYSEIEKATPKNVPSLF